MRLLAVGVSHASAPLALRERLSIAAGSAPRNGASSSAGGGIHASHLHAALAALQARGVEGFVLSTCSRTEMYAYGAQATDAVQLFADVLGTVDPLQSSELRDACYVLSGDAALRHALRVASGLESIVLGEDQIHAQMKKALAVARAAGALGPVTERLGAAALSCSKAVRTETGIAKHAVSLESLAVRAATERSRGLATRRVLLIGAGDSASIILKHLRSAGVADITIMSRTASRALEMAQTHGVRARGAGGASELAEALAEADVVFCSTSAPHPVVTPELLAMRRHVRGNAGLLCVDLGMPRDVDPTVAELGVDVVSLDVLAKMAEAHRASRREHVPAAESIVEREAARFAVWLHARAAASAVSTASSEANDVVQAELARVLARLESASLRDRELVAEMAHRIARKLLHGSITSLKQGRSDDDPLTNLETTVS